MEIIGDILKIYSRILNRLEYLLPMLVEESNDFILMLFETDESDELFDTVEPLLELAAKKGIFIREFRPWCISVLAEIVRNIHTIHSEHKNTTQLTINKNVSEAFPIRNNPKPELKIQIPWKV
jgi:hypothetical protein